MLAVGKHSYVMRLLKAGEMRTTHLRSDTRRYGKTGLDIHS